MIIKTLLPFKNKHYQDKSTDEVAKLLYNSKCSAVYLSVRKDNCLNFW